MPDLPTPRYSPSRVAQLCGTHVATVWRWMLHGVRGRKLRYIHIGGRRYVLHADLTDFFDPSAQSSDCLADQMRRAEAAGKVLDAKGVSPETVVRPPGDVSGLQ